MGLRRAAAAFVLVVSGCAEWPRLAHIPVDTSLDEAPREVVSVQWAPAVTEAGDNDQPWLAEQMFTLEPQTGAVIDGSLDGFLWGEGALPEVVTAPPGGDCLFLQGDRSPANGDYLRDVDFYVVDTTQDATLCAEVRFNDALDERIWDLTLMPIDCGIPGPPIALGDLPLGFSLSGQQAAWGQRVEVGRYALGLGGANFAGSTFDVDASKSYSLSVSLVPNAANGDAGLCPLPGFEVP